MIMALEQLEAELDGLRDDGEIAGWSHVRYRHDPKRTIEVRIPGCLQRLTPSEAAEFVENLRHLRKEHADRRAI